MHSMTTLIINGRTQRFSQGLNVRALLKELDIADKRFAIERNGEIIPRGLFDSLVLENGDKLEIVVAVGGG